MTLSFLYIATHSCFVHNGGRLVFLITVIAYIVTIRLVSLSGFVLLKILSGCHVLLLAVVISLKKRATKITRLSCTAINFFG